jgi:hypothetical protein
MPSFDCFRSKLTLDVIVLRRRLHLAAVQGTSRTGSCESLFRFVARRSVASSAVQFQSPARPVVRCSLYDMLVSDVGA